MTRTIIILLIFFSAPSFAQNVNCNTTIHRDELIYCSSIEVNDLEKQLIKENEKNIKAAQKMDKEQPAYSNEAALKDSIEAFEKYKKAECHRVLMHHTHGREAPINQLACEKALLLQRIKRLEIN